MKLRLDGPALVAGLCVAGLGFLPLAALVGAPGQRVELLARMSEWPGGLLVALLGAVLAAIVGRAVPTLTPQASRRLETALLALALLLPLGAAVLVFERAPLLVDEVVQVLQGRTYAGGHLTAPLPARPEFSSVVHEAEHAGRRFGQFPPAWPAVLGLLSLVGAEWLAGPLCALLVALLFRALLRGLEPDAPTRLLALGLFVLSPFTWFMAGSHMNHGLAVAGILAGLLGTLRLLDGAGGAWAVLSGAGFGVAVATRPLDGAAFALPAAITLLAAAVRRADRRVPVAVAAAAGAAFLALIAVVNWQTTGDPRLFGYQLLWGHVHDLGFHEAPWGPPHTPVRGLALVHAYLVRLQSALFESPVPGLLAAAVALLAWRTRTATGDRLLLAGGGLLLLGYWAYWHDGDFLGPRFLVPLGPLAALWSARLPLALAGWIGDGALARRAGVGVLTAAVVSGLAFGVPVRWIQYRSGFTSMRWPLATWAAEAGVREAVVYVRESWGSRTIAKLWSLGVSRTGTERLYRSVDICTLHKATAALTSAGVRGAAAEAALQPLRRDSALVRGLPVGADTSARWLPGRAYDDDCRRELAADSVGSLNYLPFRLVRDGNLYLREVDIDRTGGVPADDPRPRWRAVRAGLGVDAGIRFERLP